MAASGVILALLLLLPAAASAQVTVETDRPGVPNSTKPVPLGYVQVGCGYRDTRHRAGGAETTNRSWAETTVLVGVTPAVELRVDGEPYVDLRDAERGSGIGDIVLGAKWRLFDA